MGYIQSFQFAILNLLSHVQCIKKRQMLKNIYLTVRYIEYAQRRTMKMMMVASLVVRSGCGTPLWLRGGKGGGVVVGGGVMDIDRNLEYRDSFVIALKLAATIKNE